MFNGRHKKSQGHNKRYSSKITKQTNKRMVAWKDDAEVEPTFDLEVLPGTQLFFLSIIQQGMKNHNNEIL